MKILILQTIYEAYFDLFYKKNPNIHNTFFKEHKKQMLNYLLLWSSELANHMNKNGYKVEVIIENAKILQKVWANENKVNINNNLSWQETVVLSQIKKFKPDLLWILNPEFRHNYYIKEAKNYYKKLAFFLGHRISNKKKLIKQADMLFTSSKELVYNEFPKIKNLFQIGVFFPSRALKKIKQTKKKYDVVFVGSITHEHKNRAEVLSYLVNNGINLKIFSKLTKVDFISRLKRIIASIIRRKGIVEILISVKDLIVPSNFNRNIKVLSKVCLPPVYAVDYYQRLSSARIGLNIHIDMATKFSGNNRMYDVTGVGTCLISDKKKTNSNLFDTSKEIIEFDTKEDLLKILKNAKNDNYLKTSEIAKKGQKKTLYHHNVFKTFDKLDSVLKKKIF